LVSLFIILDQLSDVQLSGYDVDYYDIVVSIYILI